jgi:hypothetical protein
MGVGKLKAIRTVDDIGKNQSSRQGIKFIDNLNTFIYNNVKQK